MTPVVSARWSMDSSLKIVCAERFILVHPPTHCRIRILAMQAASRSEVSSLSGSLKPVRGLLSTVLLGTDTSVLSGKGV